LIGSTRRRLAAYQAVPGGGSAPGSVASTRKCRSVFFNAEGLDEPHELIGAAHQEMHAEPFEFVRADPGRGGDYFSTM